MIDIDLVNRTDRIRDARFAAILPALQSQITEDFCPQWQVEPVTLHLVGKGGQPDPAHWKVWLLDTSDASGDLGYHEDESGIPEAKIFCEEDLKYGSEISVTISHELLEMLADPQASRMGPIIDGAQYIVEAADPVESDEDSYEKPGLGGQMVKVSNFVLMTYFQPGAAGPWDWLRRLPGPCPARLPGGYSMFMKDGSWQSVMSRYADGSLSQRAIRPYGRSWKRAAKKT